MIMRSMLLTVVIASAVAGGITRAGAQAPPERFAVFRLVLPSVVRIRVEGVTEEGQTITNHGTGFVVSSEGYILTAFHVVAKDKPDGRVVKWQVNPDGKRQVRYTVEQVNEDQALSAPNDNVSYIEGAEELDIALLRLDTATYPPVRCKSVRLDNSTPVKGIGWRPAPSGAYDGILGTVSSTDPLTGGQRLRIAGTFRPGHAGGPIFTDDGDIVAVMTSGQGGQGAPAGETYATPIDEAMLRFLPEVSRCRRTAVPSLGQPADEATTRTDLPPECSSSERPPSVSTCPPKAKRDWWVGTWASRVSHHSGARLTSLIALSDDSKYRATVVYDRGRTIEHWGSYMIKSPAESTPFRKAVSERQQISEANAIAYGLRTATRWDDKAKEVVMKMEATPPSLKFRVLEAMTGKIRLNVEGSTPAGYVPSSSLEYDFVTHGEGFVRITGPGVDDVLAQRHVLN